LKAGGVVKAGIVKKKFTNYRLSLKTSNFIPITSNVQVQRMMSRSSLMPRIC